MLHFALAVCVLGAAILLLDVAVLAALAKEPFSAVCTAAGTFVKDFGIGSAAIHGGVGGLWYLKNRG